MVMRVPGRGILFDVGWTVGGCAAMEFVLRRSVSGRRRTRRFERRTNREKMDKCRLSGVIEAEEEDFGGLGG